MNNTNTPMAEAKIQARRINDPDDTWADVIEIDPVMIPVEPFEGAAGPYLTDVFNATVIGISNAIVDLDAAFSEGHTTDMLEYNLVWSGSGFSVKGVCPVCDDVFPIAEGFPGDEVNEGYDAVCCGCDPRDSFNG